MTIKFHHVNVRRVNARCWRIYTVYDENTYNGATGERGLLRDQSYFRIRDKAYEIKLNDN